MNVSKYKIFLAALLLAGTFLVDFGSLQKISIATPEPSSLSYDGSSNFAGEKIIMVAEQVPLTEPPKKVNVVKQQIKAKAPQKAKPQSRAPSKNYSSGGSIWDRIAKCESSGNWSASNPSGKYTGGLQFDRQTWASGGGTQYSSHAGAATKQQQIAVAENIRAKRGYQPWTCASKLGIR